MERDVKFGDFIYFLCAKHKICFSFTFQFSVFGFQFVRRWHDAAVTGKFLLGDRARYCGKRSEDTAAAVPFFVSEEADMWTI